MKEHPILFSGEMVRAILAGKKTQTRRVIKPQPELLETVDTVNRITVKHDGKYVLPKCPYGQVGDSLWVREKFAVIHGVGEEPNENDYLIYATDASQAVGVIDSVKAWRPSIFMPRIYSRIALRITDIRVERVQEISEDDCIAEGIEREFDLLPTGEYAQFESVESKFKNLWDSINAKRGYSWESNPWTWVIEFEKVNE